MLHSYCHAITTSYCIFIERTAADDTILFAGVCSGASHKWCIIWCRHLSYMYSILSAKGTPPAHVTLAWSWFLVNIVSDGDVSPGQCIGTSISYALLSTGSSATNFDGILMIFFFNQDKLSKTSSLMVCHRVSPKGNRYNVNYSLWIICHSSFSCAQLTTLNDD